MAQATLILNQYDWYIPEVNPESERRNLPEAFGFIAAGLISMAIWLSIAALVFFV